MSRPVRFGFQLSGEHLADPVAAACRAEELGFDVVLVSDHVGSALAPVPTLAAIAASTRRIRLGTFVLNNDMRNPVHLYFGVRSERDIYGLEWLADLQKRHPGLHVHTVVASGRAPGCRTGLVTDAIRQDWPKLDGFRAYLCGAPPMVEATSLLIRQMGVLPEHIHADAFYASST